MNQTALLPCIRLIATGGTIAMRYDTELKASVPALDGKALLAIAPDIANYANIDLDNFGNKPSAHMDASDWIALHQSVSAALSDTSIDAIVITHGTDILEDNAFFLDATLNTTKPVVMVGALRDASAPDRDGPGNLLEAVKVAVNPRTISHASALGVTVVMNGKICTAREVRKSHTLDIAAFTCGEAEYLGQVVDGRVEYAAIPGKSAERPLALNSQTIAAGQLPRVDIITMYPGADDTLINAAIAAGAKGLVIQALGAGNLNLPFYNAIKKAIDSGIPVVVTSRVPNGPVAPAYGFKGGGQTLQVLGAIFAADLPAHKARIILMLALENALADIQALEALLAGSPKEKRAITDKDSEWLDAKPKGREV